MLKVKLEEIQKKEELNNLAQSNLASEDVKDFSLLMIKLKSC